MQGGLEAVPLDAAYSKLAAKWEGYFERSHDDGEYEDSDASLPLPGQGTRRSLFRKLRRHSRPQARVNACLPWPVHTAFDIPCSPEASLATRAGESHLLVCTSAEGRNPYKSRAWP